MSRFVTPRFFYTFGAMDFFSSDMINFYNSILQVVLTVLSFFANKKNAF